MRPLVLPLLLTLFAPPAGADPRSGVIALADAFHAGAVQPLWEAATPELQAAFGSPGALADLRAGLGDEVERLSERFEDLPGHALLTRTARWSMAPDTALQTLVTLDAEGRLAGFHLRPRPEAAPSPHADYRTRADLRLPVAVPAEGAWFVYWGGREIEDNYHAADPGQRFALDLLVVRDGASHRGDPARVESYHCWGEPVLAPAAGTIVAATGDLPDQPIGGSDPANPAGNHVVIDLGQGEYLFLAHLQQGSQRVAAGDRVTPGQPLGLCGNSGNTSEPHLHAHLQTTPRLGRGLGLPMQFQDYVADGEPVARGEPRRGQIIAP